MFVAQFINTGILLLALNANMSEQWPYAITKNINGLYYDYTVPWYANVGEIIVQTMVINSLLPWITIAIGFGIPALK